VATKKEIRKQFELWNKAIQTGDPKKVVRLYAADAILLPTLSDKVRHNRREIADYFKKFLKKKPSGKIDEHNVRLFGDLAISSGVYTFTFEKPASTAQARFTYVYKQRGKRWLIVEHHSSVMPPPDAKKKKK
jgi:uncharacterized protein (TIGR02246 family)